VIRFWRWPVAVLVGILLSLAYPPVGFGPYAIVAVAVFTWVVREQRARAAFGLGTVSGFTFYALHMQWLSVVGYDAWLLLALYCGLWIGVVGLGTMVVSRLPGWPVWVAGIWVLTEFLRGRYPFGGYPWGRLAFSQANDVFAEWSYVIGMAGLTASVALCGAAIVAVVDGIRSGSRAQTLTWGTAAVALIVVPGLLPLVIGKAQPESSLTVAFVQGGTPQLGMGALDVRRVVLNNHVAQTRALAAAIKAGEVPQPDLVLWPENSSDIDPFLDFQASRDISDAVVEVGAPVLVGAVINVPSDPTVVQNVGILWDPVEGPGARYVKTRPVPFGEFIPFRAQLSSLIGRLDRIPRDFQAGREPGLINVNGTVIGDVICFEVAYDDVSNALVLGGAQLLVVQTNNATFGNTAQPEQQFDIEVLRAVENDRSVVVAATTGISAAIAPDRTITAMIEENDVGYRVVEVPLITKLPPSALIGPWVEGGLAIIAGIAFIAGVMTRRLGYRRA
jgi:apolipoprotein N-acyltransferase